MNRSDSIAKIAPALVAALSKIEGVAKTKANPGFKGTKYADLEAVIDASKDILTEHGLTVLQFPGACAGGVMTLETILLHESGEYISETMGIALGKTDPQGVGSAITYARRYAQMAALNMPAVDDDGEAAMGRGQGQQSATKPAPSAYRAKQEGLGPRVDELLHALRDTDSQVAVGQWISQNETEIAGWPENWKKIAREEIQEQRRRLSEAEMDDGFRGAVGPGNAAPVSRRNGTAAHA